MMPPAAQTVIHVIFAEARQNTFGLETGDIRRSHDGKATSSNDATVSADAAAANYSAAGESR